MSVAMQSRCSSFRVSRTPRASSRSLRLCVVNQASLQFVRGVKEPCVPEVKLSRARTGSNGAALFIFDNPSIFQASGQLGDVTGLFMEDEEGVLSTTDVKAKFVNGKPQIIEAKYQMRSQFEWERFLRFMDRYAAENGLGFEKGAQP